MKGSRSLALVLSALVLLPSQVIGDAGVLIPSSRTEPDPTMLSLEEMAIDIRIDNGQAKVLVRQIFSNHTNTVLEGNYLFALPGRAVVSDFAVWDDVTRIPGVILERKRAEEIYNNLKWQAIDPGLLQLGEHDADEARRSTVFSARVVPIPAYGTKRVEIEYQETIPVENLTSFFAVPLRPDAYRAQTANRFWITLEVRSQHTLRDFAITSKQYPLTITERSPGLIRARFEGQQITFTEDFALQYAFDAAKGDSLEILTYRDGQPTAASLAEPAAVAGSAEPGFFQASLLLAGGNRPSATPPAQSGGRRVILLFDASLSMQWEKLERNFQALEAVLRSLRPPDSFNVLVFNSEVKTFAGAPVRAEPGQIEKALSFVRSSHLRGSTDLERGLQAALNQSFSEGEPYLVLLSDGGATRGTIHSGKLAAWFTERWTRLAEARRPRTYVFAVGDDANVPLLRMLARDRGVMEWVRSTEPIEFKLNAFVSKIGQRPIENLRLTATPGQNFDLIYPLDETWFSGGMASWVGQYRQPGIASSFGVRGLRDGTPVTAEATVTLPADQRDHPQLPRLWAKARVDALLEKIERDGEDRDTIDEIIRLARKYRFVTPYTSFLAAPRALLRPRVIRPGDPVLRVRTDESIVSVVAMFPFGLIKPLKKLSSEGVWQTRFLAPTDMADGTHQVRLVLKDRMGHVFRESKSFVIVSKTPLVRVRLEKTRVRRGETVRLRVSASETTRTVVARMYGVAPIRLKWNARVGSSTGELVIPAHLPAGSYRVTVTAEDFAHNIGSQEVTLEVIP